nr:MAG TPA: hypothetical protein [Caudoviricetes sp.]
MLALAVGFVVLAAQHVADGFARTGRVSPEHAADHVRQTGRGAADARQARRGRSHDTRRDLGRGLDGAGTDLAATLLHLTGHVGADETHRGHDETRTETTHEQRRQTDEGGKERRGEVRIVVRDVEQCAADHEDQRRQRFDQHHAGHRLDPFQSGRAGGPPAGHHDRQRSHGGQKNQAQQSGREHARQRQGCDPHEDIDDQPDQHVGLRTVFRRGTDQIRHDTVTELAGSRIAGQLHVQDLRADRPDDTLQRDHHAHADRGQRPGEHAHRETLDRFGHAALDRGMQRADDAYRHVHETHDPADTVRGGDRDVPLTVRHRSRRAGERARDHVAGRIVQGFEKPVDEIAENGLDYLGHARLPASSRKGAMTVARPRHPSD